jgi:diguanylate cyclase (GGDEF)-like protein
VGDAVLVDVAARLTAAVRPGDTVARLGGDEFAILCAPTDAAELDRIAQRIRAQLSGPVLLDDVTEIAITASIGAAIADGTGRIADADALVRAADAAMYADKHRQRAPTKVKL